jgi:hypothetical protein
MTIRFVSLIDADPDAVRSMLNLAWNVEADDPFVREVFAWRYFARPRGETLVALDGERCVGIIDSLVRPYLHNGRIMAVRETCDWFCLPQYRPLAIGAALMRRLMARPEPIVSVGGTDATQTLLSRLKWQRLSDVAEYILPVTTRILAAKALHWMRLGDGNTARWIPANLRFRPVHDVRPPSPAALAAPLPGVDDDASVQCGSSYALAELLGEEDRAWLAAAPAGVGELVGLMFAIGDRPVGISLSRVEPHLFGRAGKILHLQVTESPQPTADWAVGETARNLINRGAELISCRTSCPRIGHALHRAGFWRVRTRPVYWWPAETAPPAGPIHLTYLRADDALSIRDLAKSHARLTCITKPAAAGDARHCYQPGRRRA